MISIFSLPKPFINHGHKSPIDVIQHNAIQSWMEITDDITLFGDEDGTAQVAHQYNLKRIPGIKRDKNNVPMLDFMFNCIQQKAKYDICAYVNADIMLLPDFIPVLEWLENQPRPFFMTGQRLDVDLNEPLDFRKRWGDKVLNLDGELHHAGGIDVFIHNKTLFDFNTFLRLNIRMSWDQHLLYEARRLGATLIDCTGVATIVHQNHDLPLMVDGVKNALTYPNAQRNYDLINGRMLKICDSDIKLKEIM